MINLPLVFHFNQHLNENAALASLVCYRGLLETLLETPVKANIHISGTLIQALKWLDPTPLELIRAGLQKGQFELLGSTHAQNVPFATDDRDNREQIRLHLSILEETFNVRPSAFWISERCWRQSLLPLIAEAGYRTITIEDHILQAAGHDTGSLVLTKCGEYALRVVRDDEALKHRFNYAAWFGDSSPLFRYLQDQISNSSEDAQFFAYAEDAEAMGLWGYQHGVIPNQTWSHLAGLLEAISRQAQIKTIHFAELPEPDVEVSPIPDGAAAWMDASLQRADRPYHESGFKNWFDFNRRSEKLSNFRTYFDRIRAAIDAFTPKGEGGVQLQMLARHTLLTHQYEFGCIGIGGEHSRAWRGAEAAQLLLILGRESELPAQHSVRIEGEVFEVIHSGQETAILTATGGRVLFWADRRTGRLLVGNPGGVAAGDFISLSNPPDPVTYGPLWIPDGQDYGEHLVSETPPTRMGRYLPDWIWGEGTGVLELAARDTTVPGEPNLTRPAQQGAFSDTAIVDGMEVFGKRSQMTWDGEIFMAELPQGLTIEKRCSRLPGELKMTYRLTATEDIDIDWHVTSELAGDYAEILRTGRSAVSYWGHDGISVRESGEKLRMTSTLPDYSVTQAEAMLSLRLELHKILRLEAGKPLEFAVVLSRTPRER